MTTSSKMNNKQSIIYLLERHKSLSRKELAQMLDLTPAAVTKLCAILIKEGFVIESGTIDNEDGKAGRKEITLKVNTKDKFILGINTELDCVTFSITKIDGSLVDLKELNSSDDLTHKLDKFLNRQNENVLNNILGAAICIVGNDDSKDNSVFDYDEIKDYLDKNNIKYVIENNVRAFSRAHILFEDTSSRLFLKWGPGVGSAVVHNGELLSSGNSETAEIGHYIVNPGGQKCRCGRRGCLEIEVGQKAIQDQLGDIDRINELPEKIRTLAYYNLDTKINMVALALVNTSVILDCSDVLLFGSMFKIEDVFEKLQKQYLRYSPEISKLNIAISSMNDKASYIGACAVGVQEFFIGQV